MTPQQDAIGQFVFIIFVVLFLRRVDQPEKLTRWFDIPRFSLIGFAVCSFGIGLLDGWIRYRSVLIFYAIAYGAGTFVEFVVIRIVVNLSSKKSN